MFDTMFSGHEKQVCPPDVYRNSCAWRVARGGPWFSDDLAQCMGRLHLVAGFLECLKRVSAVFALPHGDVLTDILI